MGILFGTDGVRGLANSELTCELSMNIGRAVATGLKESLNYRPLILIGKDTRISSDMLEGAIMAGICSVGADVISLGYIPTPAVAYLTRKYKANAGIMISASHNSFEFNGIKIFSSDGYKLPDELENQVEAMILKGINSQQMSDSHNIGSYKIAKEAEGDYIDYIKSTVDGSLSGIKVAIDCSNGAAYKTAERLFKDLSVNVTMLNDKPNGTNINAECGSTHVDKLMEYVKSHDEVDIGIAFDGDADRCMAVDENGNLVDGDYIMAICAKDMQEKNQLKQNTIVGTVMTNMGFVKFCKENSLNFVATKVGDKYVLEEMLVGDYSLGGEQSGHIIMKDFATTGDGQLTAVHLLSILKQKNKKLSQLAAIMGKYPQSIVNIKVTNEAKLKFYTNQTIRDTVESYKKELGENGRVVVRASGTEPLIRVMVEHKNTNELNKISTEVADIVKRQLC